MKNQKKKIYSNWNIFQQFLDQNNVIMHMMYTLVTKTKNKNICHFHNSNFQKKTNIIFLQLNQVNNFFFIGNDWRLLLIFE